MSLCRVGSTMIPVSGEISYPASEHGGTMSYSKNVYVDVVMDTTDFDNSAGACVGAVAALNGQLISTTSEVVGEKVDAARRISNSLANGFFKYIKYDLSEKKAVLGARIPALLQSLKAMAEDCRGKKKQLERDYERISGRYAKIFEDLDMSLRTSLRKLDEQTFETAELSNEVVFSNSLGCPVSQAVLAGSEQAGAATAIEVAGIKKSVENVIASGTRNIRGNLELNGMIRDALHDARLQERRVFKMPVVQIDSEPLDGRDARACFFPEELSPSTAENLRKGLEAAEDVCAPERVDDEKAWDLVEENFRRRLSEFVSDRSFVGDGDRFTCEVMRLWKTTRERHNNISGQER